MFIAVECLVCDWVGVGQVGWGGRPLSEQCCPECHSNIKRGKGNRDLTKPLAEYIK